MLNANDHNDDGDGDNDGDAVDPTASLQSVDGNPTANVLVEDVVVVENTANALTASTSTAAVDSKSNVTGTSDSAMSADTENAERSKSRMTFSKRFKVTVNELKGVLKELEADKQSGDRALLRTVKEMLHFMESLIEAHLGKMEIIEQNCHRHKLKHALSHCHRILNLDGEHIVALCKMANFQWKLHQKEEAMETAVCALQTAVNVDAQFMAEIGGLHKNQKGQRQYNSNSKEITKENYVRHHLELIFNDQETFDAQSELNKAEC